MNKNIMALSFLGFLTGCASTNPLAPTVYSHKEFGIGNKENPHFVKAGEECHDSVYANGVLVDGKRISTKEEIDTLEKEYSDWLGQAMISAAKNRKEMEALPKKYEDLDRLRSAIEPCIVAKGWVKK